MSEGTQSAQRILRTVQPTRRLFDPSAARLKYTPAAHTNVALTMEKFARAQRIAKLREANQ